VRRRLQVHQLAACASRRHAPSRIPSQRPRRARRGAGRRLPARSAHRCLRRAQLERRCPFPPLQLALAPRRLPMPRGWYRRHRPPTSPPPRPCRRPRRNHRPRLKRKNRPSRARRNRKPSPDPPHRRRSRPLPRRQQLRGPAKTRPLARAPRPLPLPTVEESRQGRGRLRLARQDSCPRGSRSEETERGPLARHCSGCAETAIDGYPRLLGCSCWAPSWRYW